MKLIVSVNHCKFGNFRKNIIFANRVKRHICDIKNPRQGHDLPTSVNYRVILPFREGFILTKIRNRESRENKTISKIFQFTACMQRQNAVIRLLCMYIIMCFCFCFYFYKCYFVSNMIYRYLVDFVILF